MIESLLQQLLPNPKSLDRDVQFAPISILHKPGIGREQLCQQVSIGRFELNLHRLSVRPGGSSGSRKQCVCVERLHSARSVVALAVEEAAADLASSQLGNAGRIEQHGASQLLAIVVGDQAQGKFAAGILDHFGRNR